MRRGLEPILLGMGIGVASCSPLLSYHSSRATGGYTEAPRENRFLSERQQFCAIQPDVMVPINVSIYDSEGPEEWKEDEIEAIKAMAQCSFEEIQKAIKTPRQAGIYCTHCLTHGDKGKVEGEPGIDQERFGVGDYWMSGEQTHALKVGDCDDGAIVAGSLLKDDGHVSYILVVEGVGSTGKEFGHAVQFYKTSTGAFGSLGINKSDNRAPKAHSIDEFLKAWSIDTGDRFTSWIIYEPGRAFPDYDTNKLNNKP